MNGDETPASTDDLIEQAVDKAGYAFAETRQPQRCAGEGSKCRGLGDYALASGLCGPCEQAESESWDQATRQVQEMLDRDERMVLDCVPGGLPALGVVAQLQGFDDWPDVERCARDHAHRVAVELLCRHRQRSDAARARYRAVGDKIARRAYDLVSENLFVPNTTAVSDHVTILAGEVGAMADSLRIVVDWDDEWLVLPSAPDATLTVTWIDTNSEERKSVCRLENRRTLQMTPRPPEPAEGGS